MVYSIDDRKWGEPTLGTPSGKIDWSITFGPEVAYDRDLFSQQDLLDSTKNAFQAWENVAAVDFNQVNANQNADVTVSFSSLPGSTVGYAEYTYRILPGTDQITNGSIRLDSDETWSPEGQQQGTSILGVTMHEVGHILGLGHVNDSNESMYPIVNQNNLGPGDIAGVRKLYGNNQTSLPPPPPSTDDGIISWTMDPTAKAYRLEIREEGGNIIKRPYVRPTDDVTPGNDTLDYDLDRLGLPGGNYEWREKSLFKHNTSGSYSDWRNVEDGEPSLSPPPPSSPPPPPASADDTVLSWDIDPTAKAYRLEIRDDGGDIVERAYVRTTDDVTPGNDTIDYDIERFALGSGRFEWREKSLFPDGKSGPYNEWRDIDQGAAASLSVAAQVNPEDTGHAIVLDMMHDHSRHLDEADGLIV